MPPSIIAIEMPPTPPPSHPLSRIINLVIRQITKTPDGTLINLVYAYCYYGCFCQLATMYTSPCVLYYLLLNISSQFCSF